MYSYEAACLFNVFTPLEITVGLKSTFYIVSENVGGVEVCAIASSPDETNRNFTLDIHFRFNGARDSASMELNFIIIGFSVEYIITCVSQFQLRTVMRIPTR